MSHGKAHGAVMAIVLGMTFAAGAEEELLPAQAGGEHLAADPEVLDRGLVQGPSLPGPGAAPGSTWYGWQTLFADFAAVGIAAATTRPGSAYPGAITFLLAAPLVHLANGNAGGSAWSLGLRLGLPASLALLGAAADTCGPQELLCGLEGAAVGGLIGIVIASLVDATVLARTGAQRPAAEPSPSADAAGLQTFLVVDPRRGMVGLGGRF